MRRANATTASASATVLAVSARPKADPIPTVTMKSNAFMLASVRLPDIRKNTMRAVYIPTPTNKMRISGSQPAKKKLTVLIDERSTSNKKKLRSFTGCQCQCHL